MTERRLPREGVVEGKGAGMILYFSGTGNSAWVAQGLAEATGDRAVNVTGPGPVSVPDVASEERVGLVFPIYAWGAPEPVLALAARLDPPESAFAFAVCTYGSEAGNALDALGRAFRLDGAYGIPMPNNYVMGSELESRAVALEKLSRARESIRAIAEDVLSRRGGRRVDAGSLAGLKSGVVNRAFNKFGRGTASFAVTSACDGCGLCARRCPAGAIKMDGGRPVWSSPSCLMCSRCINGCPRSAIQYGKGTECRGRYSLDALLAELGD